MGCFTFVRKKIRYFRVKRTRQVPAGPSVRLRLLSDSDDEDEENEVYVKNRRNR